MDKDTLKKKLKEEIFYIVKKRKLTQNEVAEVLGVKQPCISKLLHEKFNKFSTDMLMRYLNILSMDIQITIKQKPKNRKNSLLNVVSRRDND